MKKEKKKKKVKDEIPFPDDGRFFEYFFWFASTRTKKFVIITVTTLLTIGVVLGFLLLDIGSYKDENGKTHTTFNKKAMEMEIKLRSNRGI